MSPHDHTVSTLSVLNRTFLHNRKNPVKREQLKGREAHCLMCLMLRRNSVTFQCNPSRKTIGLDMQCAKSTVHVAITGLVEKGYIRITSVKDDEGFDTSNQYWIMAEFHDVKMAMQDEDSRRMIEDQGGKNTCELFDCEFGNNV